MQIHQWRSKFGNFGDDLNDWLWDFLLPGLRAVEDDRLLVGVGTLLNVEDLPADRRKMVIGAGVGYGTMPVVSNRRTWDIRCVRGPLSARALGLNDDLGIIDPAVLIADMPEFRSLGKESSVVFVPHWETDALGPWDVPLACAIANIRHVSPCAEAKSVVRSLVQAELVIAESLHAAVIADAFRVPWIPVITSPYVNTFKWADWAASIGVDYAPVRLPFSGRRPGLKDKLRRLGLPLARNAAADRPDVTAASQDRAGRRKTGDQMRRALAVPIGLGLRAARRQRPQLSPPHRVEDLCDRLRTILDRVRTDLGLG